MRKFLAALFCWFLLAGDAFAQVGFGGSFPGPGTPASAGGGGYSGQGDLKAYAIWWGMYAFSAADRGTAAINLCNVSDVVCADISTDATTGLLPNAPTVGGSDCSMVACTIKKFYNKGTSGSGYDAVQNTIGNRAAFLSSCGGLGSNIPCASATAASYKTASNYTQAQPFSMVAVAYHNSSAGGIILGGRDVGASGRVALTSGFFGANNDAICFAGSNITVSATDAVWHGQACAVDNTSTNFTIDATNTASTAGANAFDSAYVAYFTNYDLDTPWKGRSMSAGIAASKFSTTELAAANAAAKTILGY